MFEVIPQRFDKHVVIGDCHGEFQKVQRVVDEYYDNDSIGFVFLGDIIDRKGVKDDSEQGVRQTLDIIRGLGKRAIITIANHEWLLLGSVFESDDDQRALIAGSWLLGHTTERKIEANTLQSYGVINNGVGSAIRLWEEIACHGHSKILTQSTPYYETDYFIATHAGVKPFEPWEEQAAELDIIAQDMSQGNFYATPDQWFSIPLAIDATPVESTPKVVISGHAHYLVPKKEYKRQVTNFDPRPSINDYARVRLASQVNDPHDQPLQVWQDWDDTIHLATRNGTYYEWQI